MKKNSDLNKLISIFEKQTIEQWSEWDLVPGEKDDYGKITSHVLVAGCPNGVGGYLQVLFNKEGNLVSLGVCDNTGYRCRCHYCNPQKKKTKKRSKK